MNLAAVALLFALTPNTLRTTAHNFYEWLDREYPVASSDAGKHTWDDRLTDYSAAARTKRLQAVPHLIAQAKANVQHPVRLYAQFAIDSARAIDPLYNDSLMTLAKDLPPAERDALVNAKDAALKSLHGYADDLEKHLAS